MVFKGDLIMLYYFRLVLIYLKNLFAKTDDSRHIFSSNVLHLRAMPTDCNLFFIMDNAKYNKMLDLGKFYMLIHFGKFNKIAMNSWRPLTLGVELNISQPIKMFHRVQLTSQALYWKNGCIYLEHKFIVKGKVCAMALSKSCFLRDKQLVGDDELNALYGMTSPPKPELVAKWNELSEIKAKHIRQSLRN